MVQPLRIWLTWVGPDFANRLAHLKSLEKALQAASHSLIEPFRQFELDIEPPCRALDRLTLVARYLKPQCWPIVPGDPSRSTDHALPTFRIGDLREEV